MSATITATQSARAGEKTRGPKPVCRITVIGAGPYGLSISAHLRGAGIATRTFGDLMSFWRGNMPGGMKLRSAWGASNLSAPGGRYSLDEYVASGGMQHVEPIPIADFIRYGQWFQRHAVPDLDSRKVTRVDKAGGGFRILLEDGEMFDSPEVVVAAGLANQAMVPPEFREISRDFVSHTVDHVDLTIFEGKRVAVLGRGQSAMESAALLDEAGAQVEVICRGEVRWLSSEALGMNRNHSPLRKLVGNLKAPGGVGPFPLDWLAEKPGVVRLLPQSLRSNFSKRCLRPAAAGWLLPRMGGVKVNAGRVVTSAQVQSKSLSLTLDNGTRTVVDHVLLATGYLLDVSRPGILAPGLVEQIQLQPGTHCPLLSAHYESSVPGLHFAGSSAVPSYGPLMRFVSGVGYAARSITQGVVSRKP
jgi:cation diffusion facilitator CzcD-associated flavoprotein CzcO